MARYRVHEVHPVAVLGEPPGVRPGPAADVEHGCRCGRETAAQELLGADRLQDAAGATVTELRFAAVRVAECLTDALRIAESRGGRLQQGLSAERGVESDDVRRP
ncbi:hypothetical protein P6B95_20785 [Streptomyces atratus]|nr:hypothetical protein [Streptomyces atratus]WPW29574.1 hypothetical protein P6B95_20785 [Streptomyces atratus]